MVKKKKVFVAMSGGVDSSVAAALLIEAGYDVEGVTMCFNLESPRTRRPSCCGPEGIQDARRAAKILNMPHHVLDFARDVNDLIVEDFTREYLNGRTPNPCVRCNQHIKFGTLYQTVMSLGGDYLATGHYARVEHDPDRQCYQLKKAQDVRKDQTYFLYSIKKDILPKVLFPLGDKTKDDVRALARRFKLNTAERPESQDICFVPETGYKQFIRDRVGEEAFQPGLFKNNKGETVGQHKGIGDCTIGQRDKLGLALGYPAYVYKIEKETNTVYVGPEECLYAKGLLASQFNPLGMEISKDTVEVHARIRYNAPEVKGVLTCLAEGEIRVEFEEPQKSVTPGQSVMFYEGDVVLGGAVIDEAF